MTDQKDIPYNPTQNNPQELKLPQTLPPVPKSPMELFYPP